MFIESDKHWRISKSGYSIKTGWATESRIVCQYHGPPNDMDRFQRWLEDAEYICELHNAAVDSSAG